MNKIHLVAALAAIILGSMTTIQTVDAQVSMCLPDQYPCCPPLMQPLCATMQKDQRFTTDCTICDNELDKFLYQGTIWQYETTTELIQMVKVQGTQIVNLQKEIDSMKGAVITHGEVMGAVITEGRTFGVTTDWYAGGVITDGIIIGLVGIGIVVGIANLRNKR